MLHHFLRWCDDDPDSTFIDDYSRFGRTRSYTREAVLRRAAAAADALTELGVRAEDRVLLTVRNSVEWVVLDLATQFVGAVPAALAPQASAIHKQTFRDIIEPAVIVAEDDCALAVHPDAITVTDFFGRLPQETSVSDWVNRYRYDPDHTLYLASTSGTTGGYKACMIRYRNALAACTGFGVNVPLGPHDRNTIFLPLAQTRVNDLYFFIVCGGTITFANPYADLFEQLVVHRPTFLASPPKFFELAMYRHASDSRGRPLQEVLGGAEKLYTGTTPVSPDLLDYYRLMGAPLYEAYGMTECCSYATANFPADVRAETVGRPHAGIKVRITDESEIEIAGPSVFAGYFGNPLATAATLVEDWLRTGDLGAVDTDG